MSPEAINSVPSTSLLPIDEDTAYDLEAERERAAAIAELKHQATLMAMWGNLWPSTAKVGDGRSCPHNNTACCGQHAHKTKERRDSSGSQASNSTVSPK